MTSNNVLLKKWYLTLIAGFFLLLCGISSLRYFAMDVSLIDGSIPISTQVLCFAATIAAALYFFLPLIGCIGLLIISCYGLALSIQASDTKAVVFYAIMLVVLAVSINSFRRQKTR